MVSTAGAHTSYELILRQTFGNVAERIWPLLGFRLATNDPREMHAGTVGNRAYSRIRRPDIRLIERCARTAAHG